MSEYTLISAKGRKTIDGSLADAVRAAAAMNEELQPAYGVSIEDGAGRTVLTVCDGVDDITVVRDAQFAFPVRTADIEAAGKTQEKLRAMDMDEYSAWCDDVPLIGGVSVGTQECIDLCEALIEAGAATLDIPYYGTNFTADPYAGPWARKSRD